ncbi:head-tail adaptor protein [Rhizobium sp. NTR19]|uniref:Head-tail adaptor protein n=1 Tax=Neorhizobium turbinariae TaxID=2937795 RepID=A0ABT0IRP6_9HYPH|nr:head-tail adaptor protein [Neorhizobium turbinariae]MCK8780557.1 head-tail adaptor protein [Neorhizobium turbinariae]
MAITAQELDRRITVERVTSVPNDFNEPVETWAEVATLWARRRDASDTHKIEYMAAGQVGSFTVARFTVRSSSVTRTITPVDRIVHEGKVWEIRGVKEADEGRRRFIEITALKDAD